MEVENYTIVQYGKESLTYTSGEEFYTTPSGAKQTLEKFGIAIIPKCLNQEECNQMNEGRNVANSRIFDFKTKETTD